MHILEAEFVSIDDATVFEALGEMGVYVVWRGSAEKQPSYIGEGMLLTRLQTHRLEWAKEDMYALIAIAPEGTDLQRKTWGQQWEVILLDVAASYGKAARRNRAPGNLKLLDKIADKHRRLRAKVKGRNPFVRPDKRNSKLKGTELINLDLDDGTVETSLLE